MRFRDNLYWMTQDGSEDGPYCPKCWPKDGKPVRMTEWGANEGWVCPVCRHLTMRPGFTRNAPIDDSDFPNDPIR